MIRSVCFFLFLVLFLSFSLPGCGSVTSVQFQVAALNEADSGTTVSLRQNQIMTVSVHGNGSTGYTWDVVPGAEPILTQQGAPEFVPDSATIGSGGTYKFTFKATAVGTAHLSLIYHRPSETADAPLQSFRIAVTVGS